MHLKQIAPGLTQYGPSLYLVDLDLPQLTGFREFISCWIHKSDELTFVVDPGPSTTIPVLINALKKLDIEKLDYILLTHIHLDHAGGTGLLLNEFPMAQVNCHPNGIPHLIDPQKLWQGSLKVLGHVAEAFGAVQPVPEGNISYSTELKYNDLKIEILETPGHASHHISYLMGDVLFAGEVAGVNTSVGKQNYLRIATPPRFIYEVYKNSLQKAAQLTAKYICFGHHGMREDAEQIFLDAQDQLELWMQIIKKHTESVKAFQELSVFEELVQTDPALNIFPKLDDDIQLREKYFCLNSIRGMHEYFKTNSL